MNKKIRGKNRKIKLSLVYDMDNLIAADKEARKGKGNHYGVRKFDKHKEENLLKLQESIKNRTYKTSKPRIEERHCEHKTRVLSKVTYFDHVAHHALMRVILPIIEKSYYHETSASIKGRGIHYSMKHVRKYIDLHKGDLWWCQVDFKKCYHHVKRALLYEECCKTFDDDGIRWMLHDIIYALRNHNGLEESDGTEGVGIGLYPIQPLVNFHFNRFDRIISSIKGIKMFRYCDNILIIGSSAELVWSAVNEVKRLASKDEYDQPLHDNIGVQKLDDRHPIDFVGYLFYKDHTLVRKRLKYTFKHKFKITVNDDEKRKRVLAAYKGWLEHADSLHLWTKTTGMKSFSELNLQSVNTTHDGQRYFEVPSVPASYLVDRELIIKDYIDNCVTRNGEGRVCVLVEENGTDKKFITNNPRIKSILKQVRDIDEFPFKAVLKSRTIGGGKTDYYFD